MPPILRDGQQRSRHLPAAGSSTPDDGPALIYLLLVLAACLLLGCHGLSTQGDKILDENGNSITLRGANWFGFNTGATMVDGMWNFSNGFTFDFPTIVYRWQLMGFNTVRLPFSIQDLYTLKPAAKLSSSCSLPSFTQIAYSVANPADNVAAGRAFPPPTYWPPHSPNTCNENLPTDTTLSRFIWVAQYFARAGFYVILVDHNQDNTVATNQAQFIRNWTDIVTWISADTVAAKRLIVDVLNEPDSRGWGWDVMSPLYLSVMDAVYAANANVLFLVEGCGQQHDGLAYNWGDGFVTSGVSGSSDPNPFFQALFSKPYLSHVALGPHVYGPSISLASTNFAGPGLWARLSRSFGAMTKTGYKFNGATRTFPVVIGEVGSSFQNAGDLQFLPDFAAYLLNSGAAADGLHNAIPHVLWWAWNANSGDTGGLVDASWYSMVWNKVQYLNSLGLTPWYKVGVPSPSPAPAPSPVPSPAPVLSPCQARFTVSSWWSTSLGPTTSLNIYIKTLGTTTVPVPWTFQMYNPSYTGQDSAWNIQSLTFSSGKVLGTAGLSWEALVPGAAEVNIGMHISSSSSSAFIPSTFMVNGIYCSMSWK